MFGSFFKKSGRPKLGGFNLELIADMYVPGNLKILETCHFRVRTEFKVIDA